MLRVIENRDLGSPDTVVIHVGTNDLRRTGNLDYVMGDVYDFVNTAKKIVFNIHRNSVWCVVEDRRDIAAYWRREQQIRVYRKYVSCYVRRRK